MRQAWFLLAVLSLVAAGCQARRQQVSDDFFPGVKWGDWVGQRGCLVAVPGTDASFSQEKITVSRSQTQIEVQLMIVNCNSTPVFLRFNNWQTQATLKGNVVGQSGNEWLYKGETPFRVAMLSDSPEEYVRLMPAQPGPPPVRAWDVALRQAAVDASFTISLPYTNADHYDFEFMWPLVYYEQGKPERRQFTLRRTMRVEYDESESGSN